MDLILWRHAGAEETVPDIARDLTAHGRRQAQDMAQWLRSYLPDDLRIVCSPAARTRQTADALGRPYAIRNEIAPGRPMSDLLAASGWPQGGATVLLVGHNPSISQLAGTLLAGRVWAYSMPKASVLWLAGAGSEGEPGVVIRAALEPSMCRPA